MPHPVYWCQQVSEPWAPLALPYCCIAPLTMHTQPAKSVSGCMHLGAKRAGSLIADPGLLNGADGSRLIKSITKRGVSTTSPPHLGSQTWVGWCHHTLAASLKHIPPSMGTSQSWKSWGYDEPSEGHSSHSLSSQLTLGHMIHVIRPMNSEGVKPLLHFFCYRMYLWSEVMVCGLT